MLAFLVCPFRHTLTYPYIQFVKCKKYVKRSYENSTFVYTSSCLFTKLLIAAIKKKTPKLIEWGF